MSSYAAFSPFAICPGTVIIGRLLPLPATSPIGFREVANLIELLIRRHCEEVGIPIPEQSELFDSGDSDG